MSDTRTFADLLTDLEGVVARLESPELPLETSIELFERGMELSRRLQSRLDEAERKIEMLVKGEDGTLEAVPFPAQGDEPGEPPSDEDDDSIPF